MTSTISFNTNANLPLSSPASAANKKMSEISSYPGAEYTIVPGVTNIIWAPKEIITASEALLKAAPIRDKEGAFDASIRLVGTPFSFGGAVTSASLLFLKAGLYLNLIREGLRWVITPLTFFASYLGLILCAIEGLFESNNLQRASSFLSQLKLYSIKNVPSLCQCIDFNEQQKQFHRWLNKIINSPSTVKMLGKKEFSAVIEELKNLQNHPERLNDYLDQLKDKILLRGLKKIDSSYLTLSPKRVHQIHSYIHYKFPQASQQERKDKQENLALQLSANRKNSLARRIEPWMAKEVTEKLPAIITGLSTTYPAMREKARQDAYSLLKDIDAQVHKKVIAHAMGLTAVGTTLIALALSLALCHYLIPFVLLGIGGATAMGRAYFARGTFSLRGWDFSFSNCIPDLIKQGYRKIFTRAIPPPVPPVEPLLSSRKLLMKRQAHPIDSIYAPRFGYKPIVEYYPFPYQNYQWNTGNWQRSFNSSRIASIQGYAFPARLGSSL